MKLRRIPRWSGRSEWKIGWGGGVSSDAGVGVALVAAGALCAAFGALAWNTTGALHILAVVLVVITGIYFGLVGLSLLTILFGIYLVRGLVTPWPSLGHRLSWLVPSGALGAFSGLETYDMGPGALVFGPLIACSVVAIVAPRMSSRRARTRVVALSIFGAAMSVLAGLTIFL